MSGTCRPVTTRVRSSTPWRRRRGSITGAALIIVVVFVGFASGDLVETQQVGFGVAVALLIDATIVAACSSPRHEAARALELVPAVLAGLASRPARRTRARLIPRRPLSTLILRCALAFSGAARPRPRGCTSPSRSGSSGRSSRPGGSGSSEFGLYATVMAAAGFFQTLLDLTVEESADEVRLPLRRGRGLGAAAAAVRARARVKLAGGVLAVLALVALAPLADTIFDADGLRTPLLVASLAAARAGPRERRLHRAPPARPLRPARRASSRSRWGCGCSAIADRRAVRRDRDGRADRASRRSSTTARRRALGWLAFRRFPAARAGAARRGPPRDPLASCSSSSVGDGARSRSARRSRRSCSASSPARPQVGLFRSRRRRRPASPPPASPVRLILLTEQTRDWERGARRRGARGRAPLHARRGGADGRVLRAVCSG